MNVRSWRIWYADGTTADSVTSSWKSAPATGVQVVAVYYDPPYRDIECGLDTYALQGEQAVKHGSLAGDAEFEAIQALALEAGPL